jgi:hypothetical protein
MYEIMITMRTQHRDGMTPWCRLREFNDVESCIDWAAETTEEDITWYPEHYNYGYLTQEGQSERFNYLIQELIPA